MYVCVFVPRADRVLCFSIENASKRLDYPAVVYRGAVPAFCSYCHLTGKWLAALWAEKYGLIEEPLTGAVFESIQGVQHVQLQTRYVCRVLERSCS